MKFDGPVSAIAEFTASIATSDLNDEAVTGAIRHHFDAVSCGLYGFTEPASQIARRVATTIPSDSGCSVYGVANKVAPEQAVFANSTMVRQLDFNDVSDAPGHPSDFIPAIFAAGEMAGAGGLDVVRAIFIGYEVFEALGASYAMFPAGWDTTLFIGIAAAMGAGSIFGMNVEELANAVAIAMVPSVPLLCTRHGLLSNWKDSAAAHAAMNGLFAARLARAGLTGPSAPFEGADGLHRHITPLKDVVVGTLRDGRSAVARCPVKYYPTSSASMGLVDPLISLRASVAIDDIVKISAQQSERAWRIIGGGSSDREEKWNPKSRETADHSLPYIVAVSLLDGDVTRESYLPERLADPKTLALMQLISSEPLDGLHDFEPQLKIELRNGEVIDVASSAPAGDLRNPIENARLSRKFGQASAGLLSEKGCSELEAALWDLADMKDLGDITKYYRAIDGSAAS